MPELKDILEATRREATARLIQMSRLGNPTAEVQDIRAEGDVDFLPDRLRLTESFITTRMARERKDHGGPLMRLVNPLLYPLLDRFTGGSGDVFYEGGARWKKSKRGRWGGREGTTDGPKNSWHPLFFLDVLTASDIPIGRSLGTERVADVSTTKYEVELPRDSFSSEIWMQLQEVPPQRHRDFQSTDNPIVGFLWIDEHWRIRRMSYETVRSQTEGRTLWAVTEFSEFGKPPAIKRPILAQ